MPDISLNGISFDRGNHTVPQRGRYFAFVFLTLHVLRGKLFHDIGIQRIVFHHPPLCPRFGMGTSPSGLNQSDRHLQFFIKFTTEYKADSRKFFHIFRSTNQPSADAILFFSLRSQLMLHMEKPDGRIIGILHLLRFIQYTCLPFYIRITSYRKFHIRLSGAKPYFTY